MSAPPPNLPTQAFDVQALSFDKALIERLSGHGPRYTSYPSADRFHAGFAEAEQRARLRQRFPEGEQRPLSLYVHIPFCDTICYYCGCNKIITRNRAHAEPYLGYLLREMELYAPQLGGRARVEQLHLGGGTPTFFSDDQLQRLLEGLRRHLDFAPADEAEYSIEIDPRKVGPATVERLAGMGFRRMSIGVQDFDPEVQAAVNRIQSEAETMAVIEAARAGGFRSVSMDLIYGLPLQTLAGFGRTLDTVIAARPERLAIYNYAHLPHLFKTQRQIQEGDLPSADTRLELLRLAIERLGAAGYVYIGMDHFALPDDELALAQRAGTLQRNFQGYSTRAELDLLALGVSGIGRIGASYSQNTRELDEYCALIDAGRLPVVRGLALEADDELRRELIQRLMCDFSLDVAALERRWGIDFDAYFHAEKERLAPLEQAGLLTQDARHLRVTPRGRLLVRNIAMVFDRYLQRGQPLVRFSKII